MITRERWNRVAWWVRLDWWRNDGWRWRVAQLVDKLPGQCWSDLVEWALRRHEDDPDTPWNDLVRRVPLRRQVSGCFDDARRNGACYCAKVRTAEADADMCSRGSLPASVIVAGAGQVTGTPSAGVPSTRTSRRGARPPHVTDALWWLAYVGLLAAVLFLL